MMWLNLILSKKGLFAIGLIALVIGFLTLRNFYINEGIIRCQAKVYLAVNAEKDRVNKINRQAIRDSAAKVEVLENENNILKEQANGFDTENNIEPDNSCYSAERLRRVNSIQR